VVALLVAGAVELSCVHERSRVAPSVVEPLRAYGSRIVLPDQTGAELRAAIEDAASLLGEMTDTHFAVAAEGSEGIVLLRSSSPAAPEDARAKLKDRGNEAFVLRSDGTSRLLVVANGELGLRHGLYDYLERVGVRFYFPTKTWTIVPKRRTVTLTIDQLVAPAFRLRDFFGTGGFAGALPVDPKREVPALWERWKIRNRLGGDIRLGGHSGEAFNEQNKAILAAHPEYLAEVDGKNVPWSYEAKLNVGNPDAVKLYVDWTVKRYVAQRKKDPEGPDAFAVSVEPADGHGFCNSPACRKIGNDSSSGEQIFYVANEAAKAVRAEVPDGHVSLLAYFTHVLPPSFPLEPNVYVAVAPYDFQYTGLFPETIIERWSHVLPRMSVYDYWCFPDRVSDQPVFDARSTAEPKIRFWQKNHVEGLLAESTYGAGAMGLAWYVASRLLWEPSTDSAALYEEFYSTAFGRAREPMRRMLERWRQFLLTRSEIAWSARDLADAADLARDDPAVRARIADYARYLEYLRLRLELQDAAAPARAAAAEALIEHVWSIYDSTMVHSYRLFQLTLAEVPSLRAAWTTQPTVGNGWKTVQPISDDEALRRIALTAKTLKPISVAARSFTGPLVKLPATAWSDMPASESAQDVLLGGPADLALASDQKEMVLSLNPMSESEVQLVDATDHVLFRVELERNKWTDVHLPIASSAPLRLRVSVFRLGAFHVQPPKTPFVTTRLSGSRNEPVARAYFYVPKGTRRVAFFDGPPLPANLRIRVSDSKGAPAAVEMAEDDRVYLVDVPPGQDGKVWAMENVIGNVIMLNVPQVFSFRRDSLMVPESAMKP
jgi:hypothetical protein